MKGKLLFLALAALLLVQPAQAERARAARLKAKAAVDCTPVQNINTAHGVLYKDENIHGLRGLTVLFQNPKEQTRSRLVQIRTENGCKLIGTVGLYACDHPYGCRYYAAYGSRVTKNNLINNARRDGSKYVLIQGKGKWWKMLANTSRAGQVNK